MASVTFSRWEPSRKKRDWRYSRAQARVVVYSVGLILAAAVIGEVGLRVAEVCYEQTLAAVLAGAKHPLPPGAVLGGQTVNSLGYVDDDFAPEPMPGRTRVALLGGRATLAGDAATNLAAQLEARLPGVEIQHFGIPAGNPAQYAAQLKRDVLRFQPQFVLVCLSPADDVAATETPAAWSRMRLFDATRWMTDPNRPAYRPEVALKNLTETADYETYVRRRTAPVAACRTDDDDASQRQWKAAQAALGKLVDRCRERNIGVAAVLMPADFQLSPQLADALQRRVGLNQKQIDVQSPQRRWTAWTDHLQLPSLDLLPTFLAAEAVLFETSSPDWNARGRTLAAETTARWLQPQLGNNTIVMKTGD
jgi:hypothetical protein